jgi:hypothetical protein
MATFHPDTKIVFTDEIAGLVLEFRKYNNNLMLNSFFSTTGEDHYIGYFLSQFNDSKDITDDMIPLINEVLEVKTANEVISANYIRAFVEKQNTYFIEGRDFDVSLQKAKGISNMYIRTQDFMQIIAKWVDFLESQEA